jgi:hypothetical protein
MPRVCTAGVRERLARFPSNICENDRITTAAMLSGFRPDFGQRVRVPDTPDDPE